METFGSNLVLKRHPSFFTDVNLNDPGNPSNSPITQFDPGFKKNFILLVFSNFNGADIFHVLSRLNKKLRHELPDAGLLD